MNKQTKHLFIYLILIVVFCSSCLIGIYNIEHHGKYDYLIPIIPCSIIVIGLIGNWMNINKKNP